MLFNSDWYVSLLWFYLQKVNCKMEMRILLSVLLWHNTLISALVSWVHVCFTYIR